MAGRPELRFPRRQAAFFRSQTQTFVGEQEVLCTKEQQHNSSYGFYSKYKAYDSSYKCYKYKPVNGINAGARNSQQNCLQTSPWASSPHASSIMPNLPPVAYKINRQYPSQRTSNPWLSPGQESDGLFSDVSSITSSRLLEEGLNGWELRSVSNSTKGSTSPLDDHDNYGMRVAVSQTAASRHQSVQRTYEPPFLFPPPGIRSSVQPSTIVPSRGENFLDDPEECSSVYEWDRYNLQEEALGEKDCTDVIDMEICSTVSDGLGSNSTEPYDPAKPTEDSGPIVERSDSDKTTISEMLMRCLREMVTKTDARSKAFCDTIVQLIATFSVMSCSNSEPNTKSAEQKELSRILNRVAPWATQGQIFFATSILPSIFTNIMKTNSDGVAPVNLFTDDRQKSASRSERHRSRSRRREESHGRRRTHSTTTRSSSSYRSSPRRKSVKQSTRIRDTKDRPRVTRKRPILGRNRNIFLTYDRRERADDRRRRLKTTRESLRSRRQVKRQIRLQHIEVVDDDDEEAKEEEKKGESVEVKKSDAKKPTPLFKARGVAMNRKNDKKRQIGMSNKQTPAKRRVPATQSTSVGSPPSLLQLKINYPFLLKKLPRRPRKQVRNTSATMSATPLLTAVENKTGALLPEPGTAAHQAAMKQSTDRRFGLQSKFRRPAKSRRN